MSHSLGKLLEVVARDGCLHTGERLWARGCAWLGSWQLSHSLGRLRNLWRLPAARRKHRGGKLNLGCGPDWREGWLNADLGLTGDIHLNAGRRFPFPEDFFAMIFSEHMLEHLSETAAAVCLHECHRVLKPGGVLRLSTPDLAWVARRYLAPPQESTRERRQAAQISAWKYTSAVPSPAQWFNDGFYLWEHRHLYDEPDLTEALRRAGFGEIIRCHKDEGAPQPATTLETRVGESLVMEARKI